MIKPLFSESHTNKFSRFGDKTNISSENGRLDPAGRDEVQIGVGGFVVSFHRSELDGTFGKFKKDIFHSSAL